LLTHRQTDKQTKFGKNITSLSEVISEKKYGQKKSSSGVFTRGSSYAFSAIPSVCLSVCLSVTRVDQAKTVQARMTKFSPSAAWKTLVLGTVKLFHKFEGGHPERGP